jgi:pimeloyl-ACP methyl ester carboxylesterase
VSLTDRVEAWRRRGERTGFDGRSIHLFRRDGNDPVLVLLHGFPTSSYDWRLLIELEPERAVLAPDFLGFGLSEKPRHHEYSLGWQADLVEELVRREAPARAVFVAAHDMGTSVATELMARDIERGLGMDIRGALLFNGSMVQSAASPTLAQRLLRGRFGPLAARAMTRWAFRRQFGSVFSPDHPLTDEEAEDQWSLITHNRGHRLGHKLISYMDERERHADRWHGALRDWPRHLHLAWGLRDPVATTEVLAAVRELRPGAPLEEFAELGHYPHIERPVALQQALLKGVGAAL